MIGPQSTRVCYICAKACVGWTVLFLGSGVVRLLRRCLEGVAEEHAVTPGPAEQARPTGNSQIAGCVFNGRNRNGTFDKNETRMSGQTVTLVDSQTAIRLRGSRPTRMAPFDSRSGRTGTVQNDVERIRDVRAYTRPFFRADRQA